MNPVLSVDWSAVAAGLAASPAGPVGRPLIDVLFEDEEGSQSPQGSQYGPQGAQALSDAVFDALAGMTPETQRAAADAVNDFTRTRMREDGFYRRIMPPLPIRDEDLDRAVDTDRPVRVVDVSPEEALRGSQRANRADEGEPAAISIPFGTLPTSTYIRGPRYGIGFDGPVRVPRFRGLSDLTVGHPRFAEIVRAMTRRVIDDIDREIADAGAHPAEGEHGHSGEVPGAVPDVLPERRPGGDY